MEPYQQRVVEEKRQLDERLTNLKTFFGTALFSSLDGVAAGHLTRQAAAMQTYSDVLGERIAAFQ